MSTTVAGSPPSFMHRPKGRAVSRWDVNNRFQLVAGKVASPEHKTAFEVEVARLKLQPAQYQTSVQLREWVRRWCSSKYVPESLLEAWGMESLAEGFKVGWGSM